MKNQSSTILSGASDLDAPLTTTQKGFARASYANTAMPYGTTNKIDKNSPQFGFG